MKQEEMDLKDQCKYCQIKLKEKYCDELKVRVREEYGFHCPFFVFENHGEY